MTTGHSLVWDIVHASQWTNLESGLVGAGVGGLAVLKAALITGKQQAKQAREDRARAAAVEVMAALINFNQIVGNRLRVITMSVTQSSVEGARERRDTARAAAFELMKVASSRAPLMTEDDLAAIFIEVSTLLGRWFRPEALLRNNTQAAATHEYLIYAATQTGCWLKGEPRAALAEPADPDDAAACAAWIAPPRPTPKPPGKLARRHRS